MTAMPHETRGRILSGMRWTFWLSGLAVPFGFCTSLILARTSPEAIGTYGLLAVYVTVVSTMLYVGGDAVLIKFMPAVPSERRLSFLLSYFIVISGFFFLWVGLAAIWPHSLHYVFGDQASGRLSFGVLLAAPVYIFFLMVVATLKGLLEIRWAQVLLRMVTIGTFLVYAALFAFSRDAGHALRLAGLGDISGPGHTRRGVRGLAPVSSKRMELVEGEPVIFSAHEFLAVHVCHAAVEHGELSCQPP